MQELPTTFVRVLKVERVHVPWFSRGGVERTMFTFEASDGRVHRASVLGHPHIVDGMSVVAVLARTNDWQSLVGWVVQPTGEVAGSGLLNTEHVIAAVFAGAIGCTIAALNDYWLASAAFGAVTVWVVASLRKGIALDQRFRSLQRRVTRNAP
jgi:hypothetical protein